MCSKPRQVIFFVTVLGFMICGLALTIGSGLARNTLASPSAPNDVVIGIYDFYFDPPSLTVSLGTTVIWRNWGEVTHTVFITGVVNSGDIAPGDIFTHTFNTKDSFAYQCIYHPEMQASITVVDAQDVPIDLWTSAWHDQVVSASAAIDYHVEYANADWSFDAQNVVLTATLPAASTLVTSTMSGNPFTPTSRSGQVLVYNIGPLAASESNVIDLVVHLPSTLRVNDNVVLTARVSSTNPDPNPDNNYTENSETIPGANMTLYKRPAYDSGPFVPGGMVTYTLEYYNSASYIEATNVVVTDRLPLGMTFTAALLDNWTTVTPITPTVSGNLLTFNLGTLPPGEGGRLLVEAKLDPNLFAKTVLRNTAGVATSAPETSYDDNWTFDEQTVAPILPDLWVEAHSSSDGQIDGYQSYWVNLGNSGPLSATNVSLSLSIPIELVELEFNSQPDTFVTRTHDYLATWNRGTLDADSWGDGVYMYGRINAAGQITLTASITSASPEADPMDNVAYVGDFNAEILMPIIELPSTAIVEPQPVFFGLGQPNTTVTLYLSGTVAVSGRTLGQGVVDDYGRWVITPTSPINTPGWYWFTATQQAGNRISPVTGVGNFVTDTQSLILDTNSMVRYYGTRDVDTHTWPPGIEGERVGGINQMLGWRRGITYTLGAQLTRCGANDPISPTLQVLLYNDDGLMVGHQDLAATYTETLTGYVEFEFGTPEDESFELFVRYYCPVTTTLASRMPSNPARPSGWWQDLKDWFGCWESLGCDKPDPPPPPKPGCPGCTPIPRPRPRPKPTDPDGFVYDCSMVRAGATITQSIITQAWVTATQRTGVGLFTDWNALEYDQVNPQKTDGVYPDKVLKPGYYSFLVPSGDYRIQATALGYVPFESQVLHVTNFPVTLNVPMKRLGEVGDCAPTMYRVFLPIAIR